MRNEYKISVGKPERKRPLGRPRHRWKNNIKIHVIEIGCCNWTASTRLRIRTHDGFLRNCNEP
jgi:hypothetical protein